MVGIRTEITLKIVADVEHAVRLFNRHSPQFIACRIGDDPIAHKAFFDSVRVVRIKPPYPVLNPSRDESLHTTSFTK